MPLGEERCAVGPAVARMLSDTVPAADVAEVEVVISAAAVPAVAVPAVAVLPAAGMAGMAMVAGR